MAQKYPMVTCDKHPGLQQSYLACVHVMCGDSIAHHLPPSQTEMGELLCDDCANTLTAADAVTRKVMVVCKPCALDKLKGKLPN